MSDQNPTQPTAPPPQQPQQPHPPPAPLPGSRAYTNLQQQIMKNTFASVPEPRPGVKDHPRMKELVEKWTRAIDTNEAHIATYGPRISFEIIRNTIQFRFNRALMYWRVFRIMDLPPEIISNIFHLVVWSSNHPLEGVKQRLYLTWVCKAWRRLMTEDPIIWNAIWFHDAPPYERSWQWFERAGSARLDIRLNEVDPKMTKVQDPPPKFTAELMSDVLDRLFTKLPQIRMLVVIVNSWPPALTVIQKLQAAGNAGIPINIERLEIHRSGVPYVWIGPGFDTQGHRDPAVLFGGQTKHLQYLCLSGIHIDFNDSPISNLTTLDLRHIAMESSPTLSRFREILKHSPALDKLTLDGCGPQPEPKWLDHAPVELPNLRTLTLGSFNLSYACYIVAQINGPRLRDLSLMNMVGSDYIPLIAMLTRRFMQVRLLSLYNIELAMNATGRRTFVRWLESMPEIGYARLSRIKPEVLSMFGENPTNYRKPVECGSTSSSGALHSTPASHVLCPKFECMEVQGLPAATIADFCRLRKRVGVPMKKMYLNTPWMESLSQDDIRLLQQESTLYIAPIGANTEEENILLGGGWEVRRD